MTEAELRQLLPPGLSRNNLPLHDYRPAAVLVPIEPKRGVWLTRRSADMLNHAGQVAFPGGKIERSDPTIEAAALREAAEEIGLESGAAEVLGRMDDCVTVTGFHITPVIALVPCDVMFFPSPTEVRDVFCLPFETLLDRRLPRQREAFLRGARQEFLVWPHERHVIWGVTARILYRLALQLRGAD